MSLKEDIKRFPSLDLNTINDLEHISKYDFGYLLGLFYII